MLPKEAEQIKTRPPEQASQKAPIVEVMETPEALPTGEGIEVIGGANTSVQTVVDDATGQPLVTPTEPTEVEIVMPLTADEIRQPLKLPINRSLMWLQIALQRLILMTGRFTYKPKPVEKAPVQVKN
jgi:hypothetical protein